MAIPYPYNRLGINAGGTVTPIEPIEGSRGVYWYATNNTQTVISSAMQLVNRTMDAGNMMLVWGSGYLINPVFSDFASIYVYSGGTALNIKTNPSAYRCYIRAEGYISGIKITPASGYEANSVSISVTNGGYVSDIFLSGSAHYVIANSGVAQGIVISGYNNYLVAGNSGTFFDVTQYCDNRNGGVGNLYIEGRDVLASNFYRPENETKTTNFSIDYNYFSVYVRGSSCTNINLIDLNLGSYAHHNFDGFGSSNKITGTHESGSYWLSNNTAHNFLLRPDGNYFQLYNTDTLYFDTLYIPLGGRLLVADTSAYYNGNNITKRANACLQYPRDWSAFSINGVTDENGSFAYSNGMGSNVVYGGSSYYRFPITLRGSVINPYIRTEMSLFSGVFISPQIRDSVWLKDGGTILAYQNQAADYGEILLGNNMLWSSVYNGSHVTSFYTYTENPAVISNAYIDPGVSLLGIYNAAGTALNITQGSAGQLVLKDAIFPVYSRVSYNSYTAIYSDYRTVNGVNPYGSFWYSNGTFVNPYVYGSGIYAGNEYRVLHVYTGASVLGGNIFNISSNGFYLHNGGYVSGITVRSVGTIRTEEAAYSTAPTAISIEQLHGGNIMPSGRWMYYGTNISLSNRNGLWPVVNGVNEFGPFSNESGVLYNWAFYCNDGDPRWFSVYSNRVDNIHAATSLHLSGSVSLYFSCYPYSDYDSNSVKPTNLTNIDLQDIYLTSGPLLILNHKPAEYALNVGTVYISGKAFLELSGSYSNALSQYPYTGITVAGVRYYSNAQNIVNTLYVQSGKDKINYVQADPGANIAPILGNYGTIHIASNAALFMSVSFDFDGGATAYVSIDSGGYCYFRDLYSVYTTDIRGTHERGNFIISGTYASNLMYNMPPNRFSGGSADGAHIRNYTVNNLYVDNNNVVRLDCYGVDLSVGFGRLALADDQAKNKYAYIYVADAGSLIVSYYCTNVSYVYITNGHAYISRSAAVTNITNSGGTVWCESRVNIVSADVNHGGIMYIGGQSSVIFANGYTSYYNGLYVTGSYINVQSDATLHVGQDCTVYSARANLGGTIIVSQYGTALNLISNGGASVISMRSAYITYDGQ